MTSALRLSVLDQSPGRQGLHGGRGAARHARPRTARRPARLPPLLAGRAPRPEAVARELREVAASHGAQEVIAVNVMFDHQARRRSYELLAEAFELCSQA